MYSQTQSYWRPHIMSNSKAPKSPTNNEWCSDSSNQSTEGTKYFHDKAKKSATNNQWVSRNTPAE